jgi:hypothetical protein
MVTAVPNVMQQRQKYNRLSNYDAQTSRETQARGAQDGRMVAAAGCGASQFILL